MNKERHHPSLSRLGIGVRALHPYLTDALVVLPSGPGGPANADDSWVPLRTLIENPEFLASQIDQRVRTRTAANPLAAAASSKVRAGVVASALFQTLAWRALGPAIALAVIEGAREPGAPGAWVRFGPDGSIRFGHEDVPVELDSPTCQSDRSATTISAESLDALRTGPWAGFLLPLTDTFRAIVRFGPRQLPGNAASPIASIVRLLVAHGHLHPAQGEPVHRRITNALGLDAFGTWRGPSDDDEFDRAWFQRGTCCLTYRVGSGTCGDCSLRTPDELDHAAQEWWAKNARPHVAASDRTSNTRQHPATPDNTRQHRCHTNQLRNP